MTTHSFVFSQALLMLVCFRSPSLFADEGYVTVPGGRVWYRVVGTGPGTPLLVLHGGPGAPSHYLGRIGQLGDERPVIFYDQLDCGRSDHPGNTQLWRVERFVEELKEVRCALGVTRVHFLGHSWGTMLATDYILTRPQGVSSLILASPCLSVSRFTRDMAGLGARLPQHTQEVLHRHGAAGTTDSAEYQEAVMVFMRRHFCRMEPWPRQLTDTVAGFGGKVYNFMWGPSEFHVTGTLKDYERTQRLSELKLPVLYTAGRFDECTPEATAWCQSLTPNSCL